jgi:hypothetical protein
LSSAPALSTATAATATLSAGAVSSTAATAILSEAHVRLDQQQCAGEQSGKDEFEPDHRNLQCHSIRCTRIATPKLLIKRTSHFLIWLKTTTAWLTSAKSAVGLATG